MNFCALCCSQYPDAWGADAGTDSWFYENYIGDRARLAHTVVSPRRPQDASLLSIPGHAVNTARHAVIVTMVCTVHTLHPHPNISTSKASLFHCQPHVWRRGVEHDADIASQANKPIIMEECGSQTFYGDRDHVRSCERYNPTQYRKLAFSIVLQTWFALTRRP